MSEDVNDSAREMVDAVYRSDSRRVLATLIRLLGDFDLAEEAMQEAFAKAVERWPTDGVPANPRAWLVSTGRFRAIDGLRRRARFDASLSQLAERLDVDSHDPAVMDDEGVEDDRLRLIFTCCHPALTPDAQLALTLREVCGLATEEIASAFLTRPPTLAQRIVRAKAKIHDARIPYQVPSRADLPDRLDAVLHVVYLVFNEGYSASSGTSLTRNDLSGEAIRLGRLLVELLPEPEAVGLLALMLLHESRRPARMSPTGELILLDDQDRSLWNREQIAEGSALVERALASRRIGRYTLQAAIAAVHTQAPNAAAADWAQIVGLYDVLVRADPSPVVELNRAAAIAMRDGPLAGLALIDAILARGDLKDYHLAHSARAELCRRLGRSGEARASYQRARALTRQEPERRFLERRLSELGRPSRIETYEDHPAACLPADPAAGSVAAAVAKLIEGAAAGARVEHVGSTAVPDLPGKGVIDLMMLYPPGYLAQARDALDRLGFQRQRSRDPFPEERPMRVGALRWNGTLYRLHVHVLANDAPEPSDLRAFRDRLRRDPAFRERYAALKREILDRGVADSLDYSRAKSAFIADPGRSDVG